MIDIIVLGSYKCGSTSLVKYLKDKNPTKKIVKAEVMYMPKNNRTKRMLIKHPEAEYWIIIRKDVEAFYHSLHEYFNYDKSFTDAMKLDDILRTGLSPIELGNFQKYIDIWKGLVKNLNVVIFEDMIQLEDFPHLRKTEEMLRRI